MGIPKEGLEEARLQVQVDHPAREAEAPEVEPSWRASPVPARIEAAALLEDPEPPHTSNETRKKHLNVAVRFVHSWV